MAGFVVLIGGEDGEKEEEEHEIALAIEEEERRVVEKDAGEYKGGEERSPAH